MLRELRDRGFKSRQAQELGATLDQIKAAGYSDQECKYEMIFSPCFPTESGLNHWTVEAIEAIRNLNRSRRSNPQQLFTKQLMSKPLHLEPAL